MCAQIRQLLGKIYALTINRKSGESNGQVALCANPYRRVPLYSRDGLMIYSVELKGDGMIYSACYPILGILRKQGSSVADYRCSFVARFKAALTRRADSAGILAHQDGQHGVRPLPPHAPHQPPGPSQVQPAARTDISVARIFDP